MPDSSQHHIADAYLASVLPELRKPGGIWPRAVVFDLDGTLVDTAEDIAAALNQTLSEFDLPPHAIEDVRKMVGGGLAKLLQRALYAHEVERDEAARAEMLERLLALYAARPVVHSKPYEGAVDLLQTLTEAGIKCGICTNKPQPIADDVLNGLGLAGSFGFIQGADSGFPKKPDPSPLIHVMSKLRAAPHETVMVGDSMTDVKTARAASLAGVVLVSFGYTPLPASELGGDLVMDSLSELPRCLAVLSQRA
ncbi:HAD-IA family hydrolase [Methyloligella sp. 2.7D]|uniref:HAD family hydrolase n=1 Tax=unclassified Methyloligella TaxID=2625955 RepID=UPI00157E2A6C|nr:HAD-IA family hydrolase [Methyloligella sp. GL2]QKP77891.1 HAD-IA family hydrolase [Methyloligella sp. GL2]